MLLNNFIRFVLVLCYATAATAADLKCPEKYKATGHAVPLEAASVFEGKPENLVDLMPDPDTWEWDISQSQTYVRQRGESMYLVCRYKGTKETVNLKIPADATICKVEGTLAGGTVAWCKKQKRPAKDIGS